MTDPQALRAQCIAAVQAAGLMNFLNALHLLGDGAKTLSGARIRDPDIPRAFCADGEVLLAWGVVGTPQRSTHAMRLDDATRVMTRWHG